MSPKTDFHLFRREAVEHATRRLDREVVITPPLSLAFFSILSVAIVTTVALLATLATVPQEVSVAGWIVPERGLIRVAAHANGTIDSLSVSDQAPVAEGAQLAAIKISTDLTTGDASATMIHSLENEALASDAQTRALIAKAAHDKVSDAIAKSDLGAELTEATHRLGISRGRLEVAESNTERIKRLADRGFATPASVDAARSAELGVQQDVSQAQGAVLDLQRQMHDVDSRLEDSDSDQQTALANSAQTHALLSERRASTTAQRTVLVTAPIAGKVIALPLYVGQSVSPDTTLAIMTPANSGLVGELFVPSRSAGMIEPGDIVNLKYQAFPYRIFGISHGRVLKVSSTIVAPNEIGTPTVSVTEPVFKVLIHPDMDHVSAYGKAIPVRPGMLLNADVIVARRSLLMWLLEPLRAMGKSQ